MRAMHELYDVIEKTSADERKLLLSKWIDTWVVEVEASKLVPKEALEVGKLESDVAIQRAADDLKTTIFNSVGSSSGLMFYGARPVSAGVEFKLAIAFILRSAPPETAAQTTLGLA